MKCPKCNGKLAVFDSRVRANNTTWRRLECVKCRERYTSVEELQGYSPWETSNLSKVFEKLAKQCIISGSFTSSLTGGTYNSREAAYKDTVAELERIYNEQ